MKKVVLSILLALVLTACAGTVVQAPAALPEQVQTPITSMYLPIGPPFADYTGGGDCSADGATGDLYPEPDFYCLTAKGEGEGVVAKIAKAVKNATQAIVTALTPTNTPTLEPTGTPQPTITGTPSPTQQPTGTPQPTNTPVVTQSPEPTNTPVVTQSPEPTQEPTEEAKECKNNNSGKDGTPQECNAGGGQEKHQ